MNGQSGNPGRKPKDLANFGEFLMKEFTKPWSPALGGKTVTRSQGQIVAQQMVKNAIRKGPAATALLLKFIESHEARQAPREATAPAMAIGSNPLSYQVVGASGGGFLVR
jgi:hypothetical protein